LPACCVAERVI